MGTLPLLAQSSRGDRRCLMSQAGAILMAQTLFG